MRRLNNASPWQATLIALGIALVTATLTLVVAFVPSWAPLKQELIAGIGGAISTLVPIAFVLAHAIHSQKAGAGLSEQQVTGLVRSELSRVLKAAMGGDAGSSTAPGRVIPVRPAGDPLDPAA